MSVKELHGFRKMKFSQDSIVATRVFRTTWADRFSTSGTDPHRIPVFNESHIEFSDNADLKKCRVVSKVPDEDPEGGINGSTPEFAIVTVEYSTRPTGVVSITANTIAFVDSDPDTITDSGNGFIDAGFKPGPITVSNSANNDGTYTIETVTEGVITLIAGDSLTAEVASPLVTITQANTQIVRTMELGAQVLMQEADDTYGFRSVVAEGTTISFADTDPDTILDSGGGFGSFNTDDKVVVSGSLANDGVYKVASVATGVLTLDDAEELITEPAGANIVISQGALLEKPISFIFVQGVLTIQKTTDAFPFLTAIIKGVTIAFVGSDPDTITDSGSGFVAAGFVPGPITVSGSTDNDDDYTVDAGGVAAGVLTLIAADTLIAEGAGATVTVSQGIVGALINTVNNNTFYGKPAESFLFLGASINEVVNDTGDSQWVTTYKFQHQKRGWNKAWNKATSSFEKLNPLPYQLADFDLLDVEEPF